MKALIVEDDVNNIELLCVRLKNLDCQFQVATDGDSALTLAVEGRPDFIVLDLKLGHDLAAGVGLLKQFKAMPMVANVPVIIHSVFVTFTNDVPEATSQADYFLPKPFRFQQLKEIVQQIRQAGAR